MQSASSLLKRVLSPKTPSLPPLLPGKLQLGEIAADPRTITHLLVQQCSRLAAFSRADHLLDVIPHRRHASLSCRFLHARVLILGLRLSGRLGDALVDLYAKCGNLDYAHNAFDRLEESTRPAWTSILSAYSKQGSWETVTDLFASMHCSGTLPDQYGLSLALKAFARLDGLVGGRVVHCQVLKCGLELNPYCQGSLINMYAKCGSTSDARRVFDAVECPDMISWTTMIEGYVRIGESEEALRLFSGMQELGMKLDNITFVTVITACVGLGLLEGARDLCRQMPWPDTVAWNAIISGHSKNGYEGEALGLFQEMKAHGVKPTRSTLGSVLSACSNLIALDGGRAVHSEAIRLGLDSSVYVGSSLINMYSKCLLVSDARKIFDNAGEKNVVMWNAMIGGYLENEQPADAIWLFIEMRGCGYEADEVTLVHSSGASASLQDPEFGRQLHCVMIKRNFEERLFVGNALIDMYAKSGELYDARKVFELIPLKDNYSWNSVITGYAQNEGEEEAMRLFQRMRSEEATPDEASFASVISACSNVQALEQGSQLHCLALKCNHHFCSHVGSSLIDMYAKLGELEDANRMFMEMPERTVAAMNALIGGYARNSCYEEALDLFRTMHKQGAELSQFTFASVLPVCSGPHGSSMGKLIHGHLLKSGLLYGYDFLEVSLLSMYLKQQSLEDANMLFVEVPENKNNVLWTAMVSGYTHIGYSEEALVLFCKMRERNVLLDEATFSSALKACADLASLRNGGQVHGLIFRSGFSSHRYTASALIDMYSKCGDIGDAFQVFGELNTKDDIILWNPMIVGCAKNSFSEEALMLFFQMQQLKIAPDNVTFLGVLTACSHAGLVSIGRGFFNVMRKKYGVVPRPDHYACMVDLLGRRGYLEEAEELIRELPFEPDGVIWATMLSACKVHRDRARGKRAAEELLRLEPGSSSPYVALSSMYAGSGEWEEAKVLRREMQERGVRKSPGFSWIEVESKTSLFAAEDKLHPCTDDIYEALKNLAVDMKEEGCVPQHGWPLLEEGQG